MDEETVAGQDPEATPEGEEETPSSESVDEADQGEPEDETPPKFRRVRDDLYRRQTNLESRMESRFNEVLSELRSNKPRTREESDDSVTVRARLAADPLKTIKDVSSEQARQAAREEIRQARAEEAVYSEFPELRDKSHPLFDRMREEYQLLVGNGNQGPDLPLLAARRAAALYPDLRDGGMKARRKSVENGVRKVAATSRVESGVSKPKGDEVKISSKEHALAKRYGINLADEKQRSAFLRERKFRDDFLLGSKPDTED